MILDGWLAPKDASEIYLDWCNKYLEDDNAFETFKANQDYFKTFDVDPDHGSIYKQMVEEQFEFDRDEYNDLLERFKENDSFGAPKTYDYNGHQFSPPTLRYIKDSFFIKSHLGDDPINRILEVGAGYGGLCKTLDVILDFKEYYFVDLAPAVKVQQKYLHQFECLNDKKLVFIPTTVDEKVEDIDLFISNYSLSECNFDIQMKYYDQYISQSKYVHIIYNYYTGDFNKFADKLRTDFKVTITNDFNNKLIFAKRK
jgi:putative sugar O-methyltransferase